MRIDDFTFIDEQLKNAEYTGKIDLSSKDIYDISFLYENNNLKEKLYYLNLSDNDINSLSGINKLKNIKTIYGNFNKIKYVNSLPHGVITVSLSQNKIKKIKLRREYNQLSYLDISDNDISDLSFLKMTPNLRYLNVNNNHITNFLPVLKLKALSVLYYNDNRHTCDYINKIKKSYFYLKTISHLIK